MANRRRLCIFAALVFCALNSWNGAAEIPPLFSETDYDSSAIDPDAVLGESASRGRLVSINLDVIRNIADKTPTTILFNLFDDTPIIGIVKRTEKPSSESNAWSGSIHGNTFRSIVIVVRDGAEHLNGQVVRRPLLVANLQDSEGRSFTIRPFQEHIYVVREVDRKRLPHQCMAQPPSEPPPKGPPAKYAVADNGSRFDIAIFYTPRARAAAGGTSQIKAEVDLAVAATNEAYRNSALGKTLRLVHKGEITYDESGSPQDILNRLTGKSDGHMDSVHSVRDSVKADLVSLFTETLSNCGIANTMTSGWERPEFERYAFSVVKRSCIADSHTLAHEIAHNMGCWHDLANPLSNTLFAYAYGHHFYVGLAGTEYRTIMAYAPGVHINYYSNPDVRIGIYQTGVEEKIDNVRVIENTATTVANFRRE